MNSKTEQQIKERVDDAGLAELMPDFDWDDTWQQIGDKIEPHRAQKWQRMLPYAAILLLGLFIAGWIGFRDQQDLQVAALRQPELPAPVTESISGPIAAKPETGSQTLPRQQEQVVRRVERRPELQVPAEKKVIPETIVAVPGPVPVTEPLPVATAAPIRKVKHYLDGDAAVEKKNGMPGPVASAPADRKVKHFLDIDNEDHSKMNPEYPILVRVKIFRFPVKEQGKGIPSYNPADLPLRTFIYAATN